MLLMTRIQQTDVQYHLQNYLPPLHASISNLPRLLLSLGSVLQIGDVNITACIYLTVKCDQRDFYTEINLIKFNLFYCNYATQQPVLCEEISKQDTESE